MKNKKGKSFLGMLLLLIAIGVFGYFGYSTMNQIKLGLDLAGGVSITYQAKEENPSSEDMADTIYKLQQRVQNYSTEAEVYQEGNNRINVDIPGVSDANSILEELGKPGSLIFMDSEGNQILDGKQVASAKAGMTEDKATGSKAYIVSLTFTEEGKQAFAEATTNGVGKPIYIIYDNQIISAPTVREAITGGQCQIDGMADYEEANNLASTIRIGSLSLELEEVRSNVVGTQLFQLQGQGRAAFQRSWREAGSGGDLHQLKGRSDRICHCHCIYDCRISASGSGCISGSVPVCRSDPDPVSCI